MEENSVKLENTRRLAAIVAPLLAWYRENARVLPWRENTEPYRVWLSEIMLQQTRVDTVIPYYERFLAQLPDISSLAHAPEAQLLKLWEGLGYYSRARNLQKAAKMVMEKFGGRFPETFEEILSLPGVGVYTAGAIASICFGLPTPAVDGNVLRVTARLLGSFVDIASPQVRDQVGRALTKVYPREGSGDFTQALMELGATVCLPNGAPRCETCPLRNLCSAFETGSQQILPVKTKKAARKIQEKTVLLLRFGDELALSRREPGGLLGGLWELPNADGRLTPGEAAKLLDDWGVDAIKFAPGPLGKHVFTHITWEMTSFEVLCRAPSPRFHWAAPRALEEDLALPAAFRIFLK